MNDHPPQPNLPRLPLQKPTADLYRRASLEEHNPQIERLRAELLAHIERTEPSVPPCLGCTISTECVRSVLEPHWERSGIHQAWASTRTLLFYLPADFEPCLASFAAQGPQVFNHPDTSLRRNVTYQGWSVRLPDEPHPVEVWVDESALDDALSSAFVYREREWGWVPVIALAGESVTVCGFEVDEVLLCCTQAASMNARDTMPENVYTEKELDAAALEASMAGPTPWFQGRWTTNGWEGGGARTVLGVTFYNRKDAE